jgi:hypothetical protein
MGRGTLAAVVATALLTGVLATAGSAPAEHSAVELISGPSSTGSGLSYFQPLFSSPDGRRVLFNSLDALVAEDTDRCEERDDETGEVIAVHPCLDGYERFGGVTSLLTTGPADPQLNNGMELIAASKDGTRAFFSGGPLLPGDPSSHIYVRAGGVTTPLPTGSLVWPAFAALTNVSEDGRHAFFATTNRLVPEDTDNCIDFYDSFDGTARLASPGVPPVPTTGGNLECASLSRLGTSADGDRFFLTTNAAITSADTDTDQDIYEWSGGEVRLISTGPGDGPEGGFLREVALSRDGRRVVFGTTEQLVAGDTDTDKDLYVRFDGETRLVAPAFDGDASPRVDLAALSADGSRVVVSSWQRLAAADTDGQLDVYAIRDSSPELLSIGPSGGNGDCPSSQACPHFWASWVAPSESLPPSPMSAGGTGGASEDARVVLFGTAERLVPADIDDAGDLYASVDGVTRLVSTGTNDGPGHSFGADTFRGLFVSPDGSRVFFITDDPLAVEDTDTALDVYEWHEGRTTVVPDGVPTPRDVILADHLPRSFVHDGSRVFIQTGAALTPDDTDDDFNLYGAALGGAPDCSGVTTSPAELRPANNRLITTTLSGAKDPDGDQVTIEITGVTQDEPTGRSRDAVLSSAADEVRLRAERDNKGDGRVYRISFEATDGNGGRCAGTTTVSVPRKKKRAAVDSAPPAYDSLG